MALFFTIWMVVMGAFVAVVLGKHVFGGLGNNPFNPALVARVFMLISFPTAILGANFAEIHSRMKSTRKRMDAIQQLKAKKEAAEKFCDKNNMIYKFRDIKKIPYLKLIDLYINNEIKLIKRFEDKLLNIIKNGKYK